MLGVGWGCRLFPYHCIYLLDHYPGTYWDLYKKIGIFSWFWGCEVQFFCLPQNLFLNHFPCGWLLSTLSLLSNGIITLNFWKYGGCILGSCLAQALPKWPTFRWVFSWCWFGSILFTRLEKYYLICLKVSSLCEDVINFFKCLTIGQSWCQWHPQMWTEALN